MGVKFPCGVEICYDFFGMNDEEIKKIECPLHGKLCAKRRTDK
jgi:hypothetical protein